eukprot:gene8966-10516_t
MKSSVNKILEQATSRDGRTVKIENIKIKQASGPQLVKLMREGSSGGPSTLMIRGCRLKTLPNEISQLGGLRRLVVEDNKLTEIPNLDGLAALEELCLSNNQVARFQVSISKLAALRVLDLSCNQLGTIPVRLCYMSALRELFLDGNTFSNFPSHLTELTSLETLSFADASLPNIPIQIGQMQGLTKLVLAGNALEEVPKELFDITALTYIDLSSNKLIDLPSGIGALTRLQYLYLQHNKLRMLPEEIGTCAALTCLRLNNNNITHLPATMGALEQLIEIYAHENRLMTLPAEMGGCRSLRKLYLEYNQLSLLPKQLTLLSNLALLTLHDNSLEELPSFLQPEFLLHVVRLTLHNNPFADTLTDFATTSDSLAFLTAHLGPPPVPLGPLQLHTSTNSLNAYFGNIDSIKEEDEDEDDISISSTPSSSLPSTMAPYTPPSSSPIPRSNTLSLSSPSLSHRPPSRSRLESPSPRGPVVNKTLLSISRDAFTSSYDSDSDSDSDTTSNSGSVHSKRSSISPRTSMSLSNASISLLSNSYSNLEVNSGSNSTSSSPHGSIRSRRTAAIQAAESTSSPSLPPTHLTRSSSTLLNMLSRRKSVQSSPTSSATTPPPSPHYKSFQTLFESLIDDRDYSKKRKEELINLSTDEKWSFLQRLKPDCTTFLINGLTSPKALPVNITKMPKSPRSYSKVLSQHSLYNHEDVVRLRQHLTDKPVTWLVNFAESSGIIAILSMVSQVMLKEGKTEEDCSILTECLGCIKLLVDMEMQSILLSETTDTIVPLMRVPHIAVKRATFQVLDLLCKKFPIGASVALESIRTYARRSGMTLDATFAMVVAPLNGELMATDLKVNAISLVNHLVGSVRELAPRMTLRSSVLSTNITAAIKHLRIDGEGIETSSWKDLETAMAAFETSMMDDDAISRPAVSSLSPRRDFESSTCADEAVDTRLSVLVACSSDAEGVHREVMVPVSRRTLAGDVVRLITSSSSNLREFGDWALFDRNADRFLNEDEPISSTALGGEAREYMLRMVPWKVRISLASVVDMASGVPALVEELMVPNMTVAMLVDHIVKKFLPEVGNAYALEADDFGLFLDSYGFGAASYWLEPLEQLHEYSQIFKDPKSPVMLKLRPKLVKLKFADDTYEHIRLDLMNLSEQIFTEVSGKVMDPASLASANLAHYGIFVDRGLSCPPGAPISPGRKFAADDKRRPEWIEPGRPLYTYRISNRVCLRYAVRPSQIPLLIESSLFRDNTKPDVIPFSVEEPSDSLLIAVAQPLETRSLFVQIPMHLPLQESLDTEEVWLQTGIDQSRCRFRIDSFDGQIVNQHQPLASQHFKPTQRLFVEAADEDDLAAPDHLAHNAINVWDEVNDRTTIIYDPDTNGAPTTIIRAATLNKLVEVSTNNIDVDRESMNVLLMTYMSFTTSDMLLDKLIERYNVPESEMRNKNVIQLHVIVFIKNWIEQQSPQAASGGGLEERFLERINTFIERLKVDGYSNMVPQLKRLVETSIRGKRAYAMPEVSRLCHVSTKIPSLATYFLEDELFVAQQLTLREFDTFKRIQPVEFLNQAWNKPKLQYKAPNLLKMIDRFNKVSIAVSTAILSQPKLKARVKLIGRLIKITQHLRDLNNFHLLTAFLAGIRNSSVLRLRLSWSKVTKKNKQLLEDLEKIMSMEGSFKCFRSIIKEIIPPCIPYLGVYLKDLTFIEDGNADCMEGLVNWGKKKLMHSIISIIQGCQDIPYDFGPPSPKTDLVLASFDALPIADDEVLYQISQLLEPKTIS